MPATRCDATEFGGSASPATLGAVRSSCIRARRRTTRKTPCARHCLLLHAIAAVELPGGRTYVVHIGIAHRPRGRGGHRRRRHAAWASTVARATPSLAARLQALAPPGAIYVAETTRRLVGAALEWRDLGPLSLKGLAEPTRAFEVTGVRARRRFEARHHGELGPMIDRAPEQALLADAWREATEGHGRVVVIAGEAGIGKSRLAAELLRNLRATPHTRAALFCSSLRQRSPRIR